ncbi:hypothetical protein FRC09_019937 [Ceratobasidium sp. 395]|nr:hypothetical protein FRC09_019937 [Ceratobasidium sp. 395]
MARAIEGTQPVKLKRSGRNRATCQHGCNTAKYKELYKPKSKSNPTPINQPSGHSPAPKRPAKRVTMPFNGETDDNDKRPVKSQKTEHARLQVASPPPKPPGHGPTMVGGSSNPPTDDETDGEDAPTEIEDPLMDTEDAPATEDDESTTSEEPPQNVVSSLTQPLPAESAASTPGPLTSTEEDSVLEPESHKPKKSKKSKKPHSKGKGKACAKNGSPKPTAWLREEDQPRLQEPDPSRNTLENCHADAQLVIARLQALLLEPSPDQAEYESLTHIATSLIGADALLLSAGAGPSSLQAGPSLSHAGPSSLHTGPSAAHAGSSASHLRPLHATDHDTEPSSRSARCPGCNLGNGNDGCRDTSGDDESEDDDDSELPN